MILIKSLYVNDAGPIQYICDVIETISFKIKFSPTYFRILLLTVEIKTYLTLQKYIYI